MFLNRKQRFSIRKYKIGVCSVLLGTTIIVGANQVSAEEVASLETGTSASELVDDQSVEEETTTESEDTVALAQDTEVATEEVSVAEVTEASPLISEPVAETTPVVEAAPATEVVEDVATPKVEALKSNLTAESFQEFSTEEILALTLEDFKTLNLSNEVISLLPPEKLKALNSNVNFYSYNVERVGDSVERADEDPATEGTTYTGKQVEPTEATADVQVRAIGAPPTLYGSNFQLGLKFAGDLHAGDYFFLEGQDVPVELPRKFVVDVDGKKVKIADVERIEYDSDYYRAQDSDDPTRFDISANKEFVSKKYKYKVTFNDNVEGLRDITASINRGLNTQAIAVAKDHTVKAIVKVNDRVIMEKSYTLPAFNSARGTSFKQTIPANGSTGKSYNDGQGSFVKINGVVYDMRPLGDQEDIEFSKDVKTDGILAFNAEVGGLPEGFKVEMKVSDRNKDPFTWDEKNMVGVKLPVYYFRYDDMDDSSKPLANSSDNTAYVTPNDTYMIIEKISSDRKTMTVRFFGDYSKPGIIINGTINPLKEPKDKTSKFGVKFDNDVWTGNTDSNKTDPSADDPNYSTHEKVIEYKLTDQNGKNIDRPHKLQTGDYRYADDARYTALSFKPNNPAQLVKGEVVVHYVDTNGSVIKAEVNATNGEVLEGTMYDTTTKNFRPATIDGSGDKKYKLVEKSGDYPVGTVTEAKNLATETTPSDTLYSLEDPTGTAPKGGVLQGTRHVTYVYEAVKGDVNVTYVDTDGTPIRFIKNDKVISSQPVKEQQPTGDDYTTEDKELRPPKITSVDGKVYKIVGEKTYKVGPVDDKGHLTESAPTEGKVKDTPQTVTYVYELVKGDVKVHYVDEEGNVIQEPKVDTALSSVGTPYDTRDNENPKNEETKPLTIDITEGENKGKTYELVRISSTPSVKDKEIVKVIDTNHFTDDEKGNVVEGTTNVIYVYREVKKGSVIVHYVDENGKELAPDKDAKKNEKDGTEYDTTTEALRPATISVGDKVYERVSVRNEYGVGTVDSFGRLETPKEGQKWKASDPVNGKVEADKTKEITYVYKLKEEVPKTGDVIIHYVDIDGKVLQPNHHNSDDQPVGDTYMVKVEGENSERPKTIEKDGVLYKLVESVPEEKIVDGKSTTGTVNKQVIATENVTTEETGEIINGTKNIVYVYKPVGSVIIHYVNTKGQVIKEEVVDTLAGDIDDDYNAAEEKDAENKEKPSTITKDGVKYNFKEVSSTNSVGGINVVKINKTNVVNGQEGKIVKGTTHVIYVYDEEPVKPGGEVTAQYYVEGTEDRLYEDPTVKEDTVIKEQGTPLETPYKDTPPAVLTDGKDIYDLVKSEDGTPKLKEGSAKPTGNVTETPQVIQYEYKKRVTKGSVIVNYVDELGDKIEDHTENVAVVIDSEAGTDYDTTTETLRPQTLVTTSGKVYELVPVGKYEAGEVDENGRLTDTDEAEGKVEAGKIKEITYVYKLKEELKPAAAKGSVIVNYVDELGDKIEDHTENVAVLINADAETGYDTTTETLRPKTLVTTSGKVYELVPVGKYEAGEVDENGRLTDTDEAAGKVEAGKTKEITYVYKLKEEAKGSVIVNYVDELGDKIEDFVDDVPVLTDAEAGTAYNTLTKKLRPKTLVTTSGKVYDLVEVPGKYEAGEVDEEGRLTDTDDSFGHIEAGKTKEITYVYKLREETQPKPKEEGPKEEGPKEEGPKEEG
ncbi:MucBP domain-containing protein, partial [Aerococcaceae bacterium zg-ZUI334]|uniref:MucBP domain-containing protein n=1 Tax=Aerococcaceae bacterium zg-252 TaxID=2796928 RepID=UPI001B984EDC|nr:MucBP domain-containing protein [Aerococcaceae bacterium zg-ZUI334]